MEEESDTFHIQNGDVSYILTFTTSASYLILEVEKEDTNYYWKATFTPNGIYSFIIFLKIFCFFHVFFNFLS